MQPIFDIWLLGISIIACSIAIFISIGFVERIYQASVGLKKILLPIYSLAAGSGLWINHILISIAFHETVGRSHSASMLFVAWIFAVLILFLVINTTAKQDFKFASLFANSIYVSFCSLGLYYFNLRATHNLSEFKFDLFATFYTLVFSVGVVGAIILAVFWIKNYAGNKHFLVKAATATMISMAICSIHFAYNNAISMSVGLQNDMASNINKLIGIIIALSFVCFFFVVVIVSLFFEKHGKQLFKFSLFGINKNSDFESQTMIDNLTQLANRKGFRHNLNTAITRSNQSGKTVALAYIDLDHFKPINDQYGHHVGDIVLSAVAQRLQAAVRGCDSVARLGGDEFAAIIEDIESDQDTLLIVERIIDSISLPFYVDAKQINISCSVGIALYPRDGDIDKLIVCADSAMYKAKVDGKNQFRFYDAELETASNKLLDMQHDLRYAIANNQFSLLFQPKLDCKTQLLVGAEALIRWHHPTKGLIMPKELIPAAEHLGLIDEINDWVTQEACRTIGHAKTKGIDLNLSINLSKHRFRNKNLVQETIGYLKQHGAPAKNLTIEIKETSGIKDEALFNQLIAEFKAAGIRVALDDFGLHPFTLNYLQHLNVDEIKIDRSFVSKMNTEPASWKLIDVLIGLAHTLNVNVVAEGVENELQRGLLMQLGCNHMQGYLLSKPITESDLYRFCKQHQFGVQASLLPAEEDSILI